MIVWRNIRIDLSFVTIHSVGEVNLFVDLRKLCCWEHIRSKSSLNRVKVKATRPFVHWPHMQNITEQFPPSGSVLRNADVFQEA
jgi:hypothetical protein